MKKKPRERYLEKKEKLEQLHNKNVSQEYLEFYHDSAYKASDYYKQQAISLYLTE